MMRTSSKNTAWSRQSRSGRGASDGHCRRAAAALRRKPVIVNCLACAAGVCVCHAVWLSQAAIATGTGKTVPTTDSNRTHRDSERGRVREREREREGTSQLYLPRHPFRACAFAAWAERVR
eukprot:COSAG01_NODE_4127_length_5326_cov_3.238569_9_plen_121_part_00